MVNPPQPEEILERILSRLRDEAGVTAQHESSVARALALGVADSLVTLWRELAEADRASSIDSAVGSELDRIGEFLGVPRRKATKAATQGYGPGVVFRSSSSSPVTIPAGTAVFPNGAPSTIFRTTSTALLPAYGTVSVDVEASALGPSYNVAPGALNSHNLGVNSISVSNPRAVDSGSDTESDESYRGRLYQSSSLKSPGSRASIRQALSALPGVRDVLLLENASGAGTFDAILIGIGSSVPRNSVTLAESYLADYAPFGVAYRVLLPKEIPVDISCTLTLSPGIETQRPALVLRAAQAIRAYIDSLSVEDGTGMGEFIFSELIERVGTSVFEARDYTISVSVGERPLSFGSNYRPQTGERLTSRRVRVQ